MKSSTDDLFAAIDAGDADAVAAALAADPSIAAARDADLVSAPLHALYRGHPRVAEQLAGLLPALDIFESAALSRESQVRALLTADRSYAQAWSPDGFTALHYPAFFGGAAAAEVSRLLLATGADVNARSRNAIAVLPIHSACAGNHDEVVAVLLAAGADATARQAGGFTPLHGAAQNGATTTAERLLASGADPTARAEDGRTPADLAEAAGHTGLAARLR
jgi:ankyrin repeat protein